MQHVLLITILLSCMSFGAQAFYIQRANDNHINKAMIIPSKTTPEVDKIRLDDSTPVPVTEVKWLTLPESTTIVLPKTNQQSTTEVTTSDNEVDMEPIDYKVRLPATLLKVLSGLRG